VSFFYSGFRGGQKLGVEPLLKPKEMTDPLVNHLGPMAVCILTCIFSNSIFYQYTLYVQYSTQQGSNGFHPEQFLVTESVLHAMRKL
jgi:hypothetical protein